ncbi:MAG TPA: LysR substrate-binding domain-containing protein [Rhizobiaceae bacterium]|nr:LysR substrate-binding domain-containing protein [Rhizobiaceae bacterium]
MRHVQLRAFHAVALAGGFSRAADALRLTQPAISDQVRKLEAEYDVLLFDRGHRQVTLTEQGARLLDITRRLFSAEEEAQALLGERRALTAGTLRIAADSALHVLHVLGAFRTRHPTVAVKVTAGNTQQVIAALNAWEADVGVVGEVADEAGMEVLRLNETPLVAFAARSHPVATRTNLSLAELAAQPLVLREPASKTRRKLEEAAARTGLTLNTAIEAEGREAVREIVAAGAGVGVVAQAEFGADPRLVAIPLTDADMTMEEALVCLSERAQGRLIRAFMDLAAGG